MTGLPIILDYDDTCFDTKRFKKAIGSFLASIGFSPALVEAVYAETRKMPGGYSPDAHAEKLVKLVAKTNHHAASELRSRYLKRRHELFVSMRDYVYEDAQAFIARHADQVVILTAGERHYQEEKAAGLAFRVPIITCDDGDKANALEKYLEGGTEAEFVFVDNLQQNIDAIRARFSHSKTYLMNRERPEEGGLASFAELTGPL